MVTSLVKSYRLAVERWWLGFNQTTFWLWWVRVNFSAAAYGGYKPEKFTCSLGVQQLNLRGNNKMTVIIIGLFMGP